MDAPRRKMQLRRATRRLGADEHGFLGLPPKYGNVELSRLINGRDRGYAPDFPHGEDVENCRWPNLQRNWKRFRKEQFGECQAPSTRPRRPEAR